MCDYVDSICDDELTCGKCGHEPCFVARHINEGTRKFWIEKEQELGNWRFEKRFSTMIKDSIPKDKELIKNFQKSVKGVFKLFGLNKNNNAQAPLNAIKFPLPLANIKSKLTITNKMIKLRLFFSISQNIKKIIEAIAPNSQEPPVRPIGVRDKIS